MDIELNASLPGEWADDVDRRRPSELDGLTEIRVHGVSNTPPSAMLGDPHPRQVGGDNIAGFYRTSDGPNGRHREAYSWGGLTSGAASRALWVLMLPAMLANMAGWMARETRLTRDPNGRTGARGDGTTRLFQACARLAALALTITGTTSLSYLTIDVMAVRWLPSGCGDAAGVCVLPDQAGSRAALGAVVAAVLALVISWLGRRSRNRYEDAACKSALSSSSGAGETGAAASAPWSRRVAASEVSRGLQNRDFWATSPFHRQLSAAHLAVGLAVPGLVLSTVLPSLAPAAGRGGPLNLPAVALGAGLLALGFAIVLVVSGRGSPAHYRATLAVASVSLGLAVVTGLALRQDGDDDPLRSSADTVAVLWVSALALLLPLVLQQLAVARRWVRGDFFPWSAPIVLVLLSQVSLQMALLAMIALAGTWLRSLPTQAEPAAELTAEGAAVAARTDLAPMALTTVTALVLLWLALLLALLVGFVFGTWRVNARTPDHLRPEAVRRELTFAYAEREASGVPAWAPPSGPDAPFWRSALRSGEHGTRGDAWVAQIARFYRIARVSRVLARFLTMAGILTFVALALGTLLTLPGVRASALGQVWAEQSAGPFRFLAWAALALPPAVLILVATLWRNQNLRRIVGVAFDVGTCLPRSFHPFAPPSYSERAVPELGERINRLVANGGRVIVAAHSQGSVLSACVLAREGLLSRQARTRIALVSYGSPLTTLYRWAFPTVFTQEVLDALAVDLVPPDDEAARARWRNVCYRTDYIGGRVELSDPTLEAEVNRWLVDPPSRWYVRGEPEPQVATHTGYGNDDALWREVDAMAAALDGWE
ncbi:hypothetical protein [Salana multivorans]